MTDSINLGESWHTALAPSLTKWLIYFSHCAKFGTVCG